jgi:hypothetical protein
MPNRGEGPDTDNPDTDNPDTDNPDTVSDQKLDDQSDELPAGDDEDTLVGEELIGSTDAGGAEGLDPSTRVPGADDLSAPADVDNEFDVPTRVEGKRRSRPPSGENELDPSTIVETDRE